MSEERNITEYLTGLRKPFEDHNGEHPQAVFIMQGLGVEVYGDVQRASVSFFGFHSEDFFAGNKKPMDGATFSFNFPNPNMTFKQLQMQYPIKFLIIALLAQNIAKDYQTGVDEHGNPVKFFADAEEVELPEWARSSEIQTLLTAIADAESQIVNLLQKGD